MTLQRELTLIDVFALAAGAMISSGLFILPGIAYAAHIGPGVLFAYAAAAFLALTGLLSQAELVTAMPKSGGDYFFIKRSMGPAVGTACGLLTWFSLSLKSSLALYGMAYFIQLINPSIGILEVRYSALGLICFFVIINLVSVKSVGRLQLILVGGLLVILIYYVIRGFSAGMATEVIDIDWQHFNLKQYVITFKEDIFKTTFPQGIPATMGERDLFILFKEKYLFNIARAAGIVFISFGGLLKVTGVAEEVKNPARTIPLGMISAFFIVTALYLLVVGVTVFVLDPNVLAATKAPISQGAYAFMGRSGLILLSIAAVLAFISTGNAGILAASRYPLALSRDRLLPELFGKLNKQNTPYSAIILTGFIMALSVVLNLGILAKVASTALILTYFFSCISVIIMRESRLQNYRPQFKSPLYPLFQIIGIIGSIFLLILMRLEVLLLTLSVVAVGLFIYWIFGRIRSTRESALLYLIQRMTARELTSHMLESELREIIQERDNIIKDRFDALIENADILDIDSSITVDDFFHLVSQRMMHTLSMSEENIYSALWKRERESTTVLSPILAVPHVIIEGEHLFHILPVRCKKGIRFSDEAQEVKIVFVLAGSMDERNFHLRALSAIAQIIQNPHFEDRWLRAQSIEALRDVVLLGTRQR